MVRRSIGRRIGVFVKVYYKPFLLLCAINIVAMITMLRDHYTFTDDLYRAIYGDAWVWDFNRYASSLLGYLLHQSKSLFDISPIPQIVAMMFMAATSMMLVKLFIGPPKSIKKSFWPLIMASFITLCPFMMNAWMYKFDAPCMAMAIFMSVLPYALFWEKMNWRELKNGNIKTVGRFALMIFAVVLCILAMWMSFQAACGTFLAVGLALFAKDTLDNKKHNYFRVILYVGLYLAVSAVVYFTVRGGTYYRNISTYPISQLFDGIKYNLILIVGCVIDSLRSWWKILLGLIIVPMIIAVGIRRRSWRASAMMFIFLLMVAIVGVGPYIALVDFPINGRSMMSFCLAFSLFLLLAWSVIGQKKTKRAWLYYVPIALLLYGFITFSWSLGNALANQYEHDSMYVTMILKDLSEEYLSEDDYSGRAFKITGDAGLSAVMVHHFNVFPAAKYVFFLAQEGVNSDAMGHYRLLDYGDIRTSWVSDWFDVDYNCNEGEFKELRDNYYYKIRESEEEIKGRALVCIDMKKQAHPYNYEQIRTLFSPIIVK